VAGNPLEIVHIKCQRCSGYDIVGMHLGSIGVSDSYDTSIARDC
jgi:hypothetical protein